MFEAALDAAKAATKSSASSYIIILYLVIFGAVYYFYLRPRSKKTKAARQQAKQVEVGERAQTIGGFVGTVVNRTDEFVTLRAASGVELDFVPSAIARRFDPVVVPETPETKDDEAPEGDK
jgi:preprotein translocase subunit YajC